MEKIPFTKMHGLGNNYIYINTFSHNLVGIDLTDLAIKVSDPNTGIGSDGLILICPSEKADVLMRIFNKDGSEARNCGNGLRCVAKYAFENGLVKNERFTIETLSGNVKATVDSNGNQIQQVTIDMGTPILTRKEIPMTGAPAEEPVIRQNFHFAGKDYILTAVSMGNPHVIHFVDAIEKAPIETLGKLLSDGHDIFPQGVNVGFVEKTGEKSLRYRVWERGSGITQACGTGACAALVAAVLEGKVTKGETVTIHLDGGPLFITWDSHTNHVYMKGSAETICEGTYYY